MRRPPRRRTGPALTLLVARAHGTLAAGMAVLGSGTPISRVVTQAFPLFRRVGRAHGAGRRLLGLGLVTTRGGPETLAGVRGLSRRDWALVGESVLVGMFGFSVLMLLGDQSSWTHAVGPVAVLAGSAGVTRGQRERSAAG